MIPYQVTSTAVGLAIAGTILYLVRRDHMHGPYAVWWLCVAVVVMLLGFFPKLFDRMGVLMGVSYPPILAVVIGLGLVLIKMLTMDVERSRQERKIRRLTQQLAILEQRPPDPTPNNSRINGDEGAPEALKPATKNH